jgi:xylulose-5-phosphate/fructose-6-phosphate phosphoketolase
MSGVETNILAPLSSDELARMDAWWRAANYLNVGQIYLSANPLLRQKLTVEHIKPRLLGHWGTSPGLNLIYVHMSRLIKRYDLNTIYMAGPGHGGPALIANVWLEGSYTDFYPEITQDEAGMLRLFRQFPTPGGVPSHVSVPTPGSIHEGGNSATCWCTRLVRSWTIPICSSPPWSATESRKQARSRAAGRALILSTRHEMARSYRSCI